MSPEGAQEGANTCRPAAIREHLPFSSLQRAPAVQRPSENTCQPAAFKEHLPSSSCETVETTGHSAAIRQQRTPAVQQPSENTCRPAAIRDHLPSGILQTAATPHSEPLGNSGCENTRFWPQRAEIEIKGMISVSLDACTFPNTGKH